MTDLRRNPIQVIKTDKAGPPVGPYSQGIKAGGFVFVAGEIRPPERSFLEASRPRRGGRWKTSRPSWRRRAPAWTWRFKLSSS